MPLLIIFSGIEMLLLLMLIFKLDAFFPFVITSITVGIAQGMSLENTIVSIEKGIGNTFGFLVVIIGFGAMLGKLVAESDAAQKITSRIINAFGIKRVQLEIMLTGFIIGLPLFYDIGFVIKFPLASFK